MEQACPFAMPAVTEGSPGSMENTGVKSLEFVLYATKNLVTLYTKPLITWGEIRKIMMLAVCF